MSYRVRIELNKPNVRSFLSEQKSNQAMWGALEDAARKIASRAGSGFAVKRMVRRSNRPGVIVYPQSKAAVQAQAEENRLGKALGGGS